MKRYEYDASLHENADNGGAYVVFPQDIRKEFGKADGDTIHVAVEIREDGDT